jgi:hypothetical protein
VVRVTDDKIPTDALTILADCSVAAETVAQGLERVSNHPGLPEAVSDEVAILKLLARQLIEAFENLRDWLQGQYGITLAGLAGGSTDGEH